MKLNIIINIIKFIFISLALFLFFISCRKFEDTRDDGAILIDIDIKGSHQNPAWSPDGQYIVFTKFKKYNKEPADIMKITLFDNSVTTLVSDGTGNVNLPGSCWNDSLGKIVFSSSREPHDEIYMIDENGSPGAETQVTNRGDKMGYEPSFSPDGQWIVFESHLVDQEGNGVITKYKLDGSSGYISLTPENDDCRQPNWSPKGDYILYQRNNGSTWEIWIIKPDGTGNTQVTSGSGDKTDASFSPDGNWIVYSSNELDEDHANIFIIPVTGGTSIRVTNFKGYDGAPSWSPDGNYIIFESCPGDPDGSRGTKLYKILVPPH